MTNENHSSESDDSDDSNNSDDSYDNYDGNDEIAYEPGEVSNTKYNFVNFTMGIYTVTQI